MKSLVFLSDILSAAAAECCPGNSAWDRIEAWDFLSSLDVGGWRFHVTMQPCNHSNDSSRHHPVILHRVNSTKFDQIRPKKIRESETSVSSGDGEIKVN